MKVDIAFYVFKERLVKSIISFMFNPKHLTFSVHRNVLGTLRTSPVHILEVLEVVFGLLILP